MGVKYKMSFTNAQEIECSVNFIVDDDIYNDDPIILYGGPRPFVLSEFNQESDFYKPVRPQQATIEILASAGAARLEAFITDDDDRQIKVRFDFGSFTGYWYGVLSQEDMQETWIAQNHIITLRADEGFGVLKTVPLRNESGDLLVGNYTPLAVLQYALTETVLSFLKVYIYSNLFHSSMNSGNKQTGLDQCLIDAKTFEKTTDIFDDSYTVLEKVNSAFNQTIFQYLGKWWIVRMEELYIPSSQNLTGFVTNEPILGQRANANTRYTIPIGGGQKIKPIMPEAIKTLNKPSKETSITFEWSKYPYVICNQDFTKGEQISFIVNGTGLELYIIDDWTFESTSILNPTVIPITAANYDPNLAYRGVYVYAYNIMDDYVAFAGYRWLRSCNAYVNQADNVDIEFQFNITSGVFPSNVKIGAILLYANDGTKWSLSSSTRKWTQWTTDNQITFLTVPNTSIVDPWPAPPDPQNNYATGFRWNKFIMKYNDDTALQIETTPRSGYINLLLYADPAVSNIGFSWYKDIDFVITPSAQRNRRRIIISDADKYNIAGSFKKNTEKEIFLADSYHVYRGALLQTDGFTLTNGQWSRRRYSTESFTFKRQNTIANWFENRRYKIRLEANFFGLLYDVSGSDRPIGLMNTINFIDDLPTKTFAIVNMREIDFMNCTWTAELLEIWDDNIDDTVVPGSSDLHSTEFYYE